MKEKTVKKISKMSSSIRQNLSSAAIRVVEVKTKIKNSIQETTKRRLGKLVNLVPDRATQQFQKYARFEVILALLLSLFPFLLIPGLTFFLPLHPLIDLLLI